MVSADDNEFREIARRIDEQSQDWLVLWGGFTRQFVAFPLFHAPSGTILTAYYPDALIDRMRRIRRTLRDSPGREV